MSDELRLWCLALYGVGPAVALAAVARRGLRPPAALDRVGGWRGYVPAVLLPVEWLLPPALIAGGTGEIVVGWHPVRWAGFVVAVGGAGLLVWAAVVLGRFLVHDAAIVPGHRLVVTGPYRWLRHPVYTGYLALLLGTAVATLNVWLFLLWPVSLAGIRIQAESEERVMGARFGPAYERYLGRTGRLVPRFRTRAARTPPGAPVG